MRNLLCEHWGCLEPECSTSEVRIGAVNVLECRAPGCPGWEKRAFSNKEILRRRESSKLTSAVGVNIRVIGHSYSYSSLKSMFYPSATPAIGLWSWITSMSRVGRNDAMRPSWQQDMQVFCISFRLVRMSGQEVKGSSLSSRQVDRHHRFEDHMATSNEV